MPKTLTQMKKRLEEAMSEAREAEEIIPLLKEAITKFDLVYARGEPILRMTGVDGQHASAGFALP